MFESRIISSIEKVSELSQNIDTGSAKYRIFLTSNWLKNFVDCIASKENHTLQSIALFKNSSPIALLVLCSEQNGHHKYLYSLTNYYSPIFDLIFNPNEISRQDALKLMVEQNHKFFKAFERIDLYPLTSAVKQDFQKAFNYRWLNSVEYLKSTNWKLTLDSDQKPQDYFSSRIRNTIKRKQKKFDALANAQMRIVSKPADVNQAIEQYESVYSKSWKVPEPYPEFIRKLVAQAATQHYLRLGIAEIEQKAVAAQIWFVVDDEAYIFKLAYDPDYKHLSIGTLLTAHMFETITQTTKISVVDFLTGDDHFKKDWMNQSSPLYGLQVANLTKYNGWLYALRNLFSRLTKG